MKRINVSQNKLFRYALNIPYKTQITQIMKALKILHATTLYYSQICILIKLLTDFSKSFLMECLDNSLSVKIDLYDDIEYISDTLLKLFQHLKNEIDGD